jgi:hypothetical protein
VVSSHSLRGTVALSGINWDMTESLIGTDASDFKNGSRSARLRGYGTSAMTMLANKSDGAGTISFQYRRYGTDEQVDWKVEISDDDGGNWTQVGSTFTAPASDDVQTFSETVNVTGNIRIRIKRHIETGTNNRRLNIDDITITDYTSSCTTPTTQATSFSTNTISTNAMNIAFTRGNGDGGVLVVARAGGAVNLDPTSGNTYTANAAFGTGDEIGTGNFVVYNGTAAGVSNATGNINITGLTAGTTYHYAIYEYNSTGTCYHLTELTGNATTLNCWPSTQATSFSASSITTNSATVSWVRGNGDNVMVIARAGAAPTDPTSGVSYAANSAYGSGDAVGGGFVVYNGTGTSVNVTSLSSGTTYHFAIYEYNNSGTCYNLTELTGNATTLKPEPTNYPTVFTCGSPESTSIPLTWTDATGGQLPDGYLIKWSDVSYGNITDPVDGSTANGANSTTVNQGVQSATISSLDLNTTYYFKIWSYTNSGGNIDYKTTSEPQTSCTTLNICGNENFTNMPANNSSYTSRSWTGTDGVTWTAEGARTDETINGRAICFGNSGDGTRKVTSPIYAGGMGDLSFNYVRAFTGTNARTIQVWVNGSQVGSDITVSPNSDVVQSYSSSININGNVTVEIRSISSSTSGSQVKIDDIQWSCFSCSEPTTQATTFATNTITANSMNISFTRGNGSHVLVVARANGAVNQDPTNGTSYTANTTFGSGDEIGTGNFVMYNGVANGPSVASGNIPVSGLTPNVTYHFAVYEYNSADNCYHAIELTGNETTICNDPTSQASTGSISCHFFNYGNYYFYCWKW